jgi:catechol 2,3-dioxygenase-like lactoylglutathione lyase family enzyme
MEIIKLARVGTRTERPEPTVAFFRDLLGLRLALPLEDFWVLKTARRQQVRGVRSRRPSQSALHDWFRCWVPG